MKVEIPRVGIARDLHVDGGIEYPLVDVLIDGETHFAVFLFTSIERATAALTKDPKNNPKGYKPLKMDYSSLRELLCSAHSDRGARVAIIDVESADPVPAIRIDMMTIELPSPWVEADPDQGPILCECFYVSREAINL